MKNVKVLYDYLDNDEEYLFLKENAMEKTIAYLYAKNRIWILKQFLIIWRNE